MSKEYKAQAQIASAIFYTQVTVQITGLPDNGSVNFVGHAGGVAFPGGGGALGTVITDDIVRLTRDTVSFEFNAAPAGLNVNFFDGNSKPLGSFVGPALSTVTGIGGGTGTWGKLPIQNPGAIVGVGMDHHLWLRMTLNDSWKRVENTGSVTGVAVMPGGPVFGIGMDKELYRRDRLDSPSWTKFSAGKFLAITATEQGLIGVGMDNCLYAIDKAGGFNKVPDSGSVLGVAVLKNGTVFGIGMDRELYKRPTLNTPSWSKIPGAAGSKFLAITAMGDRLLGVGTDNFLYDIDGVGKVPTSGSVTAIACYP